MKPKVFFTFTIFLLIILFAWAPWLNKENVESTAENHTGGFLRYPNDTVVVKKVPFGAIVTGNVSAGPTLPALFEETYFVSPFFTVHKLP